MERIFHWSQFAPELAKQYGIDPATETDRYQPFVEMAEQLWRDIVGADVKARLRSGTPMQSRPPADEFANKAHSYFTAKELNDWMQNRGFVFDKWKAPVSSAIPMFVRSTNTKRDYAEEVAKIWADIERHSSPNEPMTDRDISEAVADKLACQKFNGPAGKPLSPETIRKSYKPKRR